MEQKVIYNGQILTLTHFWATGEPCLWITDPQHYRVALNTCISYYRRNRRHTGRLPLTDSLGAADEDSERGERLRDLYALINRLDALEKAVVMLWLDELPYEEIAAITGLTRNNVASKLHRIKLKLREQANH